MLLTLDVLTAMGSEAIADAAGLNELAKSDKDHKPAADHQERFPQLHSHMHRSLLQSLAVGPT